MTGPDPEKLVQTLRSVQLPAAVNGVDTEQARKLLDEAADALVNSLREQRALRDELEALHATKDEEVVGKALLAATRAGEEILAEARETAAVTTAEAEKSASAITAEAEAQAAALLERVAATAEQRERETAAAKEQFERELAEVRTAFEKESASAQAQAKAALADARRELARLEADAERLRVEMAEAQRDFVEITQLALDELESSLGKAPSRRESAELLPDLRLP